MTSCDTTDFRFPMKADVYYVTTAQGPYGETEDSWALDRTVAGNFIRAGAETKEELVVNIDLTLESLIIARVKLDLRIVEGEESRPLTNLLVTNIRDTDDNVIYYETAGPRDDLPTIYEIATHQPYIGAFGKTEYYRLVLRRVENQGVLG